MLYPAHAAFVAPAKERPEIWRFVLGLALIAAIYALCIAILFGLLILTSGWDGAQAWMTRMNTGGTPTSALLILATFIGMGLGPALAARWLHGRSFGSLFGRRLPVLRDFSIAFLICGAVYAVMAALPSETAPTANLDLSLWLSFLPLALVGILIQTGAEEVLFRGYLQQQLAARFASPIIWMILPSALFALGHYQPQIFGENAWAIVAAVALFAILAADLTAKTGNIGAAWGFHFANNCVAILFFAMDGPLSGLALYTVPFAPMDTANLRPLIYQDMAMLLAIWLAIRLAVSRRRG